MSGFLPDHAEYVPWNSIHPCRMGEPKLDGYRTEPFRDAIIVFECGMTLPLENCQ